MPEESSPTEQQSIKQHPTKETFAHLRHLVRERAETIRTNPQNVFAKSGTSPTERELRNAAGESLRKEMESDFDVLTGLPNRRGYLKRKETEVKKAKEKNTPLTVAVVDLDDLKKVNDKNGHAAGDKYIKDASQALLKSIRLGDFVTRDGGDEFRVLLSETDQEGGNGWIERARAALDEVGVKASIGVSPVDLTRVEESFIAADQNMYVEKRIKKEQNGHRSVMQRLTQPVLRLIRRAA